MPNLGCDTMKCEAGTSCKEFGSQAICVKTPLPTRAPTTAAPITKPQPTKAGVDTNASTKETTKEARTTKEVVKTTASTLGCMPDLSFCYITCAAVVVIVYWPSNPRDSVIYTA